MGNFPDLSPGFMSARIQFSGKYYVVETCPRPKQLHEDREKLRKLIICLRV